MSLPKKSDHLELKRPAPHQAEPEAAQPTASPPHAAWPPLLQLQRTHGNRFVQRLVARLRGGAGPVIQPKLVVGPAGDHYEQEADRVAAQVMQTSVNAWPPTEEAAQVQRATLAEEVTPVQRQSDAESGAGFQVEPEIEQRIAHAGGGQSLPETVRQSLEPRFGADFSGVRVHTDAAADQLNQSLQARAFTTGQNIFFRRGGYAPGSESGQHLLAHELTHVIQQTGVGQGTENAQQSVNPQHSMGGVVQRAIKIFGPKSRETPKEILEAYNAATRKKEKWKIGQRENPYGKKEVPAQKVLNTQQSFSSIFKPRIVPRIVSANPSLKNVNAKPSLKNVNPDAEYLEALDKEPMPTEDPGDAEIPWLEVNDVYAGMTQTGPESWPELVRRRYWAEESVQASLFTVFTGTHGSLGGQFLDDDGKIDEDRYGAPDHADQDRKRAKTLENELKGCDIRVVDIFDKANDELSKPEALRAAVQQEIKYGRVVILAWCFSMEAFKAVVEAPPAENMKNIPPESLYGQYLKKRNQTEIKDIVENVFGDEDQLKAYLRPQFFNFYK